MSAATPSNGPSAPSQTSVDKVDNELRSVIQALYELAVSTYRNDAPNPAEILITQVKDLVTKFDHLQQASDGVKDLWIPREVIGYVEHGRNPDIYTREFVELAIKQNQYMNGKKRAFQDFRDVLADHINNGFPELRADVDEVLENTGGRRNVPKLPAITAGESEKSPADDTGSGGSSAPSSSVPVNGVMKMSISGSGRDEPTPNA
ncbi:hypothetical protein H072_1714 [Dactylellina haptotyla CBS 200.50]|uniref:Mediator of RNA polymerase II transcription subunit 10 n=1 Tax=Dactylellina haptotyla (strain CBS 200.50) TaxID=1284197 RepID=S8AN49_DACHA|nr:hypothetical protein H072_1714 [Dactylellina haptotyla CBS 200.50]